MDVRLSAEQEALRDTAAQVVDRFGVRAVGELDDASRREKLDAAVTSAGWRDLRVSGDDGAPLASGIEVAIVAEELGRGLADVPFLGPVLASELRRRAGAPAVDRFESVVLDPTLTGLLVTEDVELPAGSLAVDMGGIDTALFLRRLNDKYGLARVPLGAHEHGTDLTRPSATVSSTEGFSPLDDSYRLSADDVTVSLALGLTITCADLVGVMRGACRLSCDYASERTQYGVAIGSFQAVQHLLADAFVASEGAASATLHAAWAVDALEPPEALAAAAVAKAYCSRASRMVCETAIQVHGGIGNTWECLAHVYLRRVLMSTDVLGGAGVNLGRVLRHHGIEPAGMGVDHGLR